MMMKTRAALLPSCNISEVEMLGQVQVSKTYCVVVQVLLCVLQEVLYQGRVDTM